MKVRRILLGAVAAAALASAGVAAEHKRPRLVQAAQQPSDRPAAVGGSTKAVHVSPGSKQVLTASLGNGPTVQVTGPDQVIDGAPISYSLFVTANANQDLAPFTLDLEYSEGLNVTADLQGWQCSFGAPGHATCDWTTTLPAGQTTATATFTADAQPPYGGVAECPARSPCTFFRAALGSDALGSSSTVIVVGGNHPPTALDDTAIMGTPAAPLTIFILNNDVDLDGDPLTVSIVEPPAHGTASFDPILNELTYTPDPSFPGTDALRYRVTDTLGAAASAIVSIRPMTGSVSFQIPVVDIGNVEPGRVAFRVNFLENTTGLSLVGNSTIELVDPAEFPALLAGTPYDPSQAVSDPSICAADGWLFNEFTGQSTFTRCRPSQPVGRVWISRIKFTLSPVVAPHIVLEASYVILARSAPPGEETVRVVDDVVSTPVDTPLLIHPLVNDISLAGMPLAVTGLAAAEPFRFQGPMMQGTAQFADLQGLTFLGALYTPPAGFAGTTEFYYAASEAPGGFINGRYDYAKITVNVGGVTNQPPVAHSQTASLVHDTSRIFTLAALATDPDGNPLTVQIVTPPAHGTAVVLANGDVRYEPSPLYVGPDSFQFSVNDGQADSNIGTVSLTVTDAAPVLNALTNLTVAELTSAGFTAIASDADGDAVTFSLVGAPSGAQIDSGTGVFAWIPGEAQGPGTYTFDVRATQATSPTLFDEKPITITVTEVNAAPALALPALPASIPAGVPFGFTATASDPDIPANSLTFSLAGAPAGASIDATTGVFAWTPSAAQAGASFTFSVVVTDNGAPAIATPRSVTIAVNAGTTPPALLVSTAPDRSNPQALDGRAQSRRVYIFVGPATGITRVRFWFDAPAATTPPATVDNLAPFDIAGTAANGLAQPLDTRRVANGNHTVTAEVTLAGGQIQMLHATFPVVNSVPTLRFSTSANRSNPQALDGMTVRDSIYVFVEADPDAVRVRFWLDRPQFRTPSRIETTAPFDLAGTAANGDAMPFNTRLVAVGSHLLRATVDYPGGVSVSSTATFQVTP